VRGRGKGGASRRGGAGADGAAQELDHCARKLYRGPECDLTLCTRTKLGKGRYPSRAGGGPRCSLARI
jgi:hypothetical protein